MPKRERGASLTDLLGEAAGVPEPQTGGAQTSERQTGGPKASEAEPPAREPRETPRGRASKRGRGGARSVEREAGHVRASDGSYTRADGARRVSLQLKMDPDDKRALKVQAAEAGLSPAEYVALLVREDGGR